MVLVVIVGLGVGCRDDKCKELEPSFEVVVRLGGGIDVSRIETLTVVISGDMSVSQSFPVGDTLKDGQTSFDVLVGPAGGDGWNITLDVEARDKSGKRLAGAKEPLKGSGDGCNFFTLTLDSAGDAGVDAGADGSPDAGSDGPVPDGPLSDGPHAEQPPDLTTDLPQGDTAAPPPTCKSAGTVCSQDAVCWENPLPQGNSIFGLWGANPTEVFAVGANGTILHYDGTAWKAQASPTTEQLNGVFGSKTSVFAAGENGTVLYFNGKSWLKFASPGPGTDKLRAIWVSNNDDVFVGGESNPSTGAFYRYPSSGGPWKKVTSGNPLFSIWGIGPSEVYTGLTNGVIGRYLGTTYMSTNLSFYKPITGIWGTAYTDLYLAAEKNIWHKTSVLTNVSPTTGFSVLDIHGDGANVYAIRGPKDFISKTSFGWKSIAVPFTSPHMLRAVWAGGGEVFIAGDRGKMAHRNAAGTWSVISGAVTTKSLGDVWGTAHDNVYATESLGKLMHYDGSTWSLEPTKTSGTLTGVWGSGPGDVFAVSSNGHIVHNDGKGWLLVSGSNTSALAAVWGNGPKNVYAVGDTVLHYNGTSWTKPSGATFAMKYSSVWVDKGGEVFAVGNSNKVVHYDTSTWTSSTVGDPGETFNVVRGNDAGKVVAAGKTVYVYKNSVWSKMASQPPAGAELHALTWTTAGKLHAAGTLGGLYVHDGSTWSALDAMVDPGETLHGLWGNDSGLVAVSSAGSILRRCKP